MDVAASEPAKISYAHAVQKRASPRVLIDHISDRGGTHQEPVVVVMQTGIIFVPCGNEFHRVARKEEILQINVPQCDLLMAAVERIQPAVCVFLEKVEVRNVVLDAVAVQIAEDAQRRLLVDKQKASEIRVELLNAGARGNEIVIRPEVMKLCLDESLLKPEMIVKAVRAAPHVGSYDAELPHVQIIQAEFGGDSNAPVRWFERRVAMKRSEEHTSELQSHHDLVCRLLLEKKKKTNKKKNKKRQIKTAHYMKK